MTEKKILILAGPNGAGKTTFAQEFLPQEAGCPTFINADLIAASLSPSRPEIAAIKAGRLMLEEILEHSSREESAEVDIWHWYDSSGDVPELIEQGEN